MNANAHCLAGGFTLVEMLCAVVVASVLSSIAYPSFLGVVHRARRAEALVVLMQVQMAQERYRADHPTYGLCAGLYTRDLSRALRLSNRLQSGTVWVNRYGRSRDHILPTGGYKSSGLGKDLGREAYRANRRQKAVLIDL